MFKIPKKFNLFGREIKVEYSQEVLHDRNARGLVEYDKDTIVVSLKDEKGERRSQQELELIFLHEFNHFLLYLSANENNQNIYKEEMLVERLSGGIRELMLQLNFDSNKSKSRR